MTCKCCGTIIDNINKKPVSNNMKILCWSAVCDICQQFYIVNFCDKCLTNVLNKWCICYNCELFCTHCGERDFFKFGWKFRQYCQKCDVMTCDNCTSPGNITCKDCENS